MKTNVIRQFQVEDYSGSVIRLLDESPVYNAKTGREALNQHLKKVNFTDPVRPSADKDVIFKVTPVVIENGRIFLDYRGGKRSVWYGRDWKKMNSN